MTYKYSTKLIYLAFSPELINFIIILIHSHLLRSMVILLREEKFIQNGRNCVIPILWCISSINI